MIFAVILICLAYFAPWLIALDRRRQPVAIFALNLFLGFTGVFWIAALVWALSDGPRTPQGPSWMSRQLATLFGTAAEREGEAACRRHEPRDANPYDASTRQAIDWAKGWDFQAFMFTSPC